MINKIRENQYLKKKLLNESLKREMSKEKKEGGVPVD